MNTITEIGAFRYTYRIRCRHRQWLDGFVMTIRANSREDADAQANKNADDLGARWEFLKEV